VASIATHRRPPLGGPGNTQRVYCGRSSGLRTFQLCAGIPTRRRFPIVFQAMRSISASMTAFVFAYRCGAAPDFRWVPY